MKVRLLIITGLTLAYHYSSAQPIDIRAIRDSGYLLINRQVEYFKTTSPISFDSITSDKLSLRFVKTSGENAIYVGYDPHYFWFRFEVSNADSVRRNIALLLAQIGIRELEIFQRHLGTWKSLGKTGYKYPFASRPVPFTHYAYPISIEPNSTDLFYVGLDETHAFKVIAFGLLHPKTFQETIDNFYFLFGFLMGVMLLFFLFNIYLFLSTKDKIHAWYSLYIFLQSFLLIKQHGLDAQFLGLDFESAYRATSMAAIGLLAIGVLIHVIQLFLPEINRVKKLDRVTSILKIAVVIVAMIQFLIFFIQPSHQIESFMFKVVNIISIVGLAFVLLVCCYAFYKSNKLALLLIIALLIYIIGGLERLLFLNTDSYFFPPSILEIGIVMEAVLISFGLMLRYNEYRREKERLSNELTTERVNQQQKIETALKTDRERIKQDLHDSLGGQLSSISIGLNRLTKDTSQDTIQSIQNLTDKALAELRDSLWVLDKGSVSIAEIEQRINGLFWQYRKIETAMDFRLKVEESLLNHQMTASHGGGLYRVIQEATHNSVKHSKGTFLKIIIEKAKHYIRVTITDDGNGFVSPNQNGGEHYGLKNMKKRAELMNAQLTIEAASTGTTIQVSIPLATFAS